jgi:hypothetical protein
VKVKKLIELPMKEKGLICLRRLPKFLLIIEYQSEILWFNSVIKEANGKENFFGLQLVDKNYSSNLLEKDKVFQSKNVINEEEHLSSSFWVFYLIQKVKIMVNSDGISMNNIFEDKN